MTGLVQIGQAEERRVNGQIVGNPFTGRVIQQKRGEGRKPTTSREPEKLREVSANESKCGGLGNLRSPMTQRDHAMLGELCYHLGEGESSTSRHTNTPV